MRTLAIGDIHGCLEAFDALLKLVSPEPDDLLVTLGDYIDRGPNVRGVLDRVLELRTQCKLVTLKGNHEFMMMEARNHQEAFDAWYACGGAQTLESFGATLEWDHFASSIPDRHWQLLEQDCVAYHETATHIFVHAGAYADLPLDEQPDYILFWEKLDEFNSRPHESGKIMICGHSAQRTGRPLNLGHAVCIDTWVYGDGWLTCLDVESGRYWQANQRGETREGCLDAVSSEE